MNISINSVAADILLNFDTSKGYDAYIDSMAEYFGDDASQQDWPEFVTNSVPAWNIVQYWLAELNYKEWLNERNN